MPLTEQRRSQLDSIVQQMTQNKENDDNIQFVVDDFKQKYEGEGQVVKKESGLLSLGKKLGGVFGGEKIGEFLGQQTVKLTPAAFELRRSDPELAKKALAGPPIAPVIADVAQAGLNIAGLKGAGTFGSLGMQALKTAGLGAGLGATEAIKQGGGAEEAARGGVFGGAVGGLIPPVGKALGILGNVLTIQTPRQLTNLALKTPLKKAEQGVAEAFIKRGLGGRTLSQIEDVTSKEVKELGEKIAPKLEKSKQVTKLGEIFDSIAKVLNIKTGSRISSESLMKRVADFVPDHADLLTKETITMKEANQLRMAIDNNLKETTFLGKELTNEQKTIKNFADRLRIRVQRRTGTEKLFKKQSEAIRINDLAQQAINKAETQGKIGGLDLISAGAGGLFGGGDTTERAAKGVGAAVAFRGLRSAPFLGVLARLLRSSNISPAIAGQLSPVERTTLLNLFKGFGIPKSSKPAK